VRREPCRVEIDGDGTVGRLEDVADAAGAEVREIAKVTESERSSIRGFLTGAGAKTNADADLEPLGLLTRLQSLRSSRASAAPRPSGP
jgi:hypothetical protein